jgi:lambda repressor-like predicted transcriptional regulator
MRRRKQNSKQKQRQKSPRRSAVRKKLSAAKRLQIALAAMRSGKSLVASARKAGYSRKQLRSVLIKTKLGKKKAGRWVLAKRGGRRMLMFSIGETFNIAVSHRTSKKIGQYLAAVKQFFDDQDLAHLEPYRGKFITDLFGKKYEFEVRPNHLYRLDQAGSEPYEQVYQYIV